MIDRVDNPGQDFNSSARHIGELLRERLHHDPHFYFFSPDETTSNKLDAVYDATTRAWNQPTKLWDLPESPDGRIVELLSENTLFAVMAGHLTNREQAVMTSYESFFEIIASQIIQQIKFYQQSDQVAWRPKYPAVNLLSTSTCWRQDHNGFTHQSPALISTLLNLPSRKVNCLFPIDDVAAEAALDHMFTTTNVVNLTTFNKTDEPRWIDGHHAKFQYDNGGASIFQFASDDDPDFIFTAAGDIASRETLYAMRVLRNDIPGIKLRFVGITALSYNAIGTVERPLDPVVFHDYFPKGKPIIANFHGYAATLQQILSQYTNPHHIYIHGFEDRGTTTTPFEMLSVNHASRYHLAIDAAKLLGRDDLVRNYQQVLRSNTNYALTHGLDQPDITNFRY